jgi:hypothetical protein
MKRLNVGHRIELDGRLALTCPSNIILPSVKEKQQKPGKELIIKPSCTRMQPNGAKVLQKVIL